MQSVCICCSETSALLSYFSIDKRKCFHTSDLKYHNFRLSNVHSNYCVCTSNQSGKHHGLDSVVTVVLFPLLSTLLFYCCWGEKKTLTLFGGKKQLFESVMCSRLHGGDTFTPKLMTLWHPCSLGCVLLLPMSLNHVFLLKLGNTVEKTFWVKPDGHEKQQTSYCTGNWEPPPKRRGHRCPVNYGLSARSPVVNLSCCDLRPSLLLMRRTSTDPSPPLCRSAMLVSLTVKAHASRIRVSVSFFFSQPPLNEAIYHSEGLNCRWTGAQTAAVTNWFLGKQRWKTCPGQTTPKMSKTKKTQLGFEDSGL